MANETSVGIFSASNVAAIINHKNMRDYDRPLNLLFPNVGYDSKDIEIRIGSRRPSRLQHTSTDGEGRPVARGTWKVNRYKPSVMKAFDIISSDDVANFRLADELQKILSAGGNISGSNRAIMDRARRRLAEIGEALQTDLSEEKHALICGALQGSIAFTLDGQSQTVSYGLTGLDAPSPVWNNASATIPKNMRTYKRVFAENSPDGVEPDAIIVPADIVENAFDGNTEWKDFAKRTPELALEFLGRQSGMAPDEVKPGPFGLKWFLIKGQNKSVAGADTRRWPINTVTFLNIEKARLSWGMCVGTEYNDTNDVKVEIEPPAKADVKTWKCHGFFNGLPVIGEPGNVQTLTAWTV